MIVGLLRELIGGHFPTASAAAPLVAATRVFISSRPLQTVTHVPERHGSVQIEVAQNVGWDQRRFAAPAHHQFSKFLHGGPAFEASWSIGPAIRRDLQAVRDRDPTSRGFLMPFLFFKGFQALQAHRVAHWFWDQGRQLLAVHLQNRISEVFGVDIHPAARIGSGILLDHATSLVIGETAVVEDNISILHEVTLGGTGKVSGDRHPKVRHGVLIGAGAKVLGNIEIGAGAKIGAGSVVLDRVPPHCTVAGVPAKIVARAGIGEPALEMDQMFPHEHEAGSGI